MKARSECVLVGRVLHEDDAYITLEICKDLSRELTIRDGDKYLTVLFVRAVGRSLVGWLPWAGR